jgi:putative phosphoesterase
LKVGIISDTHDNARNLAAALAVLHSEGVTTILHCGDVCGPDTVRALAGFAASAPGEPSPNGFNVWIAQGNMDRHPGLALAVDEALGHGRLKWLHRLAPDGYRLAMMHGDNEEVLRGLISSGQYNYVFHGHTHRRRDQAVGHTRVVNPGALGGMRRERRSLCILDLATGELRSVGL